jgi:hypothetical protein
MTTTWRLRGDVVVVDYRDAVKSTRLAVGDLAKLGS